MIEAQRSVHSLEMLHCKDILPWIRFWNERVKER